MVHVTSLPPSRNLSAAQLTNLWRTTAQGAETTGSTTFSLNATATVSGQFVRCSLQRPFALRGRSNATAPRPPWLFDPASFAAQRYLRSHLPTPPLRGCATDSPLILLPRRPRHIPRPSLATQVMPEAMQQQNVLMRPLERQTFRSDYDLADGLQAIADIAEPGRRVATFIGELYEASTDTRLTDAQRRILQVVAAVFDVLSGFLPGMAPLKRVGMLADLAAKMLRNDTIRAEEMSNLMMLFRDIVEQRLTDLTVRNMPVEVLPNMSAEMPKHEQDHGEEAPAAGGPDEMASVHEEEEVPALLPGQTRGPPASLVRDDAQASHDGIARQEATYILEVHRIVVPEEPQRRAPSSQLSSHSGANEPIGAVPRPLLDGDVDSHSEIFLEPSNPLREAALIRPPARDGRQGAPAGADKNQAAPDVLLGPDEALAAGSVLGRASASASGSGSGSGSGSASGSASASGSGSGSGNTRAGRPLRYTLVEDIPVFPEWQASGVRPWREFPREQYCECARVIFPRDRGQEFTLDGQDFVILDGQPYPVMRRLDGQLAVYSRNDPTLPLLPLQKEQGMWRFKPLPAPLTFRIPRSPDTDGFIRISNHKYIRVDDKYYETERVPIDGEYLIAAAARPISERIYGGNHISVMQSLEYGKIIEGKWGYYPIVPFGVVGAKVALGGDAYATLLYDFAIERWRVVSLQRDRAEQVHMGAEPVQATKRLALHQQNVASSSMESLYNWADLSVLPFYRRWPRLGASLESTFVRMAQNHLVRFNRVKVQTSETGAQSLRSRESLQSLQSQQSPQSTRSEPDTSEMRAIRSEIFRQLPSMEIWKTMSIVEQQQSAARVTKDIYENVLFWQAEDGSPAFCSEMTDILMIKLMRSLQKKTAPFSHIGSDEGEPLAFLQLSIREMPGPGRSHVALMVFDSVQTMKAGFGDVLSAESKRESPLRVLDRDEFRQFVTSHRNHILMIDPWGPEKIVDFGAYDNADIGLTDMMENLYAAGFGRNEHSDATGERNVDVPYRVRALEPALSGLAGRERTSASIGE